MNFKIITTSLFIISFTICSAQQEQCDEESVESSMLYEKYAKQNEALLRSLKEGDCKEFRGKFRYKPRRKWIKQECQEVFELLNTYPFPNISETKYSKGEINKKLLMCIIYVYDENRELKASIHIHYGIDLDLGVLFFNCILEDIDKELLFNNLIEEKNN